MDGGFLFAIAIFHQMDSFKKSNLLKSKNSFDWVPVM
jgi:hypothetical protein